MFTSEPIERDFEPIERDFDFDYTALDMETRIVVQKNTCEIKSLMRRNVQENIDIGQKLIEVKEKLDRGQFGKWIAAEFDWGWTTACKFMNVAKTLKFSHCENLQIALSALYLISHPSTPEEARQEILKLAEKGESIRYKRARTIIDRHKKEELQRKELEVENLAPGSSSNSPVESLEPETNESDNHRRQDKANDDANQSQKQVIGEDDDEMGDDINAEQLEVWIVATPHITKERLNVSTWPKAELERMVAELERIFKELKQEIEQ